MAMSLEKLKKVVEMANRALTDGERKNACAIVLRECNELGLKFDDVMHGRWPTAPTNRAPTWTPPTAQNPNAMGQQAQAQGYGQSEMYQEALRRQRSAQDIMSNIDRVRQKKEWQAKHNAEVRERLRNSGLNL